MLSALETKADKKPWALSALPPFPAVALKILEILSREDVDVRQVVAWIQSDPAFAAELLRVANSALYGFSYTIHSVQHATVTLGLDFVKALSMTVAMRAYVKSSLKIPLLRRCWRHSLATAILSEELGVACRMKGDQAYTAGLLHDVGRIGLLAAYPTEYNNVLSVSAEHDFDVLVCERDLFDIDHCEAGQWLASEWKLPPELAAIAGHHHDDPTGPLDLLGLVQIACRLSDALDFGALKTRQPWSMAQVRGYLPDFAQEGFDPEPEELRKRITARIDAVS